MDLKGFDDKEGDYEQNTREISKIDNIGSLKAEEHLYDDYSIFRLETELFENLLGFSAEELLERADHFHGTSFSDYDVEDYEYGNGWAIFLVEE